MNNAAAIIAGSVVFSTVAAFALLNVISPETDDPTAPALESLQVGLTAMGQSFGSLSQRISDLETQVEAAALTASRVTMPEISDAQLERVVARVLDARGTVPADAVARAAEPELDLQSIFTSLQGTNPDQMTEVWDRVKASGQIDELIALFEENARVNPGLAQAQLELGNAYLQQLMSMTPGPQSGVVATQADQAFDAALTIDPNHWSARFTKAVSLTFWPDFLGKKKDAIAQLEILIGQQEQRPAQPNYAQTYLYLGNLYEQQGDPEKATAAWKKGLGLFPTNAELQGKVK